MDVLGGRPIGQSGCLAWWLLVRTILHIRLHFAAVDLDMAGAGAVVTFLRAYPLVERQAAGGSLVGGEAVEGVGVGCCGEEGGVLAGCAHVTGAFPFSSG